MKNKLVKGIIGNGLAQVTLKVIRVLEQLLLIPFFLTAWGAAYYGEWVTLSIIPTVLAFSNFGFGTAAGNSFVLAYLSGDKQKAANVNKSGILVVLCSIIFGAIITTIVLFIVDSFDLFDNSLIPATEAIIAVGLLMIGRLIAFYRQLIEGYFRATRRAALGNFIYSGYFAANLLIGFFVLCFGGRVISYAFSLFIISVLFTLIYFFIGRRLINLNGCKGKLTLLDVKQITSKGLGYMMELVWQSIYFQGTTMVVRLTLGNESVAAFNTMRTACRSVSQIFNVVNGSVFPELQYAYGKGNLNAVHRLFRLSILTSMFIGVIGTLLLFLFGMDIYNLWTQGKLSVSNDIWNTIILGVLFNSVWWTGIVAYSVTNKPYKLALVSTITACLSVCTSYSLSFNFGLLGIVIGVVLFDFIMMFYVLPGSCSLLGMKVIDIFRNIKEDYSLLRYKCKRI